MDLGGGALGGMGGGGGGKSGGGGGGGDMTDPMSGMGMGGDSSFGGGGLSDLAGGGSPFGFGETPSSFGGNIASQAQAAQDPTGTTGAQQSIEASQPSPGTPGGGIGGTQTGPASLGQLAQGTGEPMGSPSQPFSVPTTAVQPAQAPATPIPGSQATGPAGGVTPTPTPTPPFGAPGAGAFGGPPSDFASQFRSDVNQINLQNPEQPLQSAINQTMPGTADVGGPDQPAAPAPPEPTQTPPPMPQDQAAAAAGVPREPPTTPDLNPPDETAVAKGDRLPTPFDQRFPSTLEQLATQPFPHMSSDEMAKALGAQPATTGASDQPTFAERQYEKPPPAQASPEKPPAQPKQQTPKAAPRTQQPRAPAPHAAHPAYRTDPYGNTYTTQPGYQPSPMSPLPAYPGPSPQTWPRAAAPTAPRTAAAAPPAPGETPAQAAAANSPQGQAVQQAMNQMPTRTLLQLATAVGMPVPPQLAMAMGGQPPPLQTAQYGPGPLGPNAETPMQIPRSGTLPSGAAPIGTTPPGTGAALPPGGGRFNYFQSQGMRPPPASSMRTVNTPYGSITVHPQAAGDFQGALQDLRDAGAPLREPGSYNRRLMRPPSGRSSGMWSSHAYGAAIDLDNEVNLSPAMQRWMQANPGKLDQILQNHNLGRPLPNSDPAHIEWRGPGQAAPAVGRTSMLRPPPAWSVSPYQPPPEPPAPPMPNYPGEPPPYPDELPPAIWGPPGDEGDRDTA